MGSVSFFTEETSFKLQNSRKLRIWIKNCIEREGFTLEHLSYIFCSDEYLAKINNEYLKHDTYTDIVTFDNSESSKTIEGDIFISIDRIMENAQKFGTRPEDELHRVIIHGVLHLMGHSDKGSAQKASMREKEDACLSLRRF